MPFAGAGVPAPVMASRQGMKDLALSAVTDQGQPVVRTAMGALTGKGSGLLQSVTQNQGAAQAALQAAAQAPGQAMTIGKGELLGPGATGGFSADMMGGGGAGGGLASAATAAAGLVGMRGGAGGAAVAGQGGFGQAAPGAILAGAQPGGTVPAGAAGAFTRAASAASGTIGPASLPGVTPGMRATAPQFTALPSIPSLPRLGDVMSRLGSLAGPLASALPGSLGGGGAADSQDSVAAPARQFAGTAGDTAPEATHEL